MHGRRRSSLGPLDGNLVSALQAFVQPKLRSASSPVASPAAPLPPQPMGVVAPNVVPIVAPRVHATAHSKPPRPSKRLLPDVRCARAACALRWHVGGAQTLRARCMRTQGLALHAELTPRVQQ